MGEFTKAARKAELPPGSSKTVSVAGKSIAVFNVDGVYHAVDEVCPHMGGPLGEGSVEAAKVTCPWHGWTFDLKTGAHCGAAAVKVQTYQVKSEGEDILVAV